jgi:hypothetical protein
MVLGYAREDCRDSRTYLMLLACRLVPLTSELLLDAVVRVALGRENAVDIEQLDDEGDGFEMPDVPFGVAGVPIP